MRDEMNRNTYSDLVQKQYEKMDPIDPMTDIPEDDTRNIGTYTSQSLSSEESDHSGFSQDVPGPADSKLGVRLNPDPSALAAWQASGAKPDHRTLGEEPGQRPASHGSEGANGLEEEIRGQLPVDHVPADASFSLGRDADATYPRRVPVYNSAFQEDVNSDAETLEESRHLSGDHTDTLEDVPDADEIQAGSPVDPSVPQGNDQHGIDLLNGVGGVDDDTGRKLPEDF